jgi:two-component sensor histidine kinase
LRGLDGLDLPARLSPVMPRWLGEMLTALLCLVVAGILRLALDALAQGAAPFVLLFPATLIATVAGGWRAGALTFAVGELWAWCYEVPPRGFSFKGPAQPPELIAIALVGLVLVAVAQVFRSRVMRDADVRDAQLAERDLLLRELDHRMKNNFQTVVALISLQQQRVADPAARDALGEALARVMSISEAHGNLYAASHSVGAVDMSAYLSALCANLADALFRGGAIRLECRAETGPLDRDRAVALGLIVNELVTNAAKHAFADGAAGRVSVVFEQGPRGFRLVVEDDGRGLPPDYAKSRHGLGRGLVEAFTRQARGSLIVGQGPGARFLVELDA